MSKKTKAHIILIITVIIISIIPLMSQVMKYPEHIAYDIKVERIKFSNDSVKLTWKMNSSFTGEFVVGRGEKEFNTPDDILKAKLIGVFYSEQDGFLIDRDIQQGKNYYYTVISKSHLLKREIDILKGINSTGTPVIIFPEPESVNGIKAEIKKDNTILVKWKSPKGDKLKFNIYRSRSIINAGAELGVAEKLASIDDDEFNDKNIPQYGSYFYAVTVTDKNGIEYFTPSPDRNFTSTGIYLKGKTLATPLNVGVYLGDKDSIIIKWEKATSHTGKELSGYEIYRSEERINSLLKLKFAKLIQIVNTDTIIYTDKEPGPGKYYYAVFSRYNDGTVDLNFDDDSSYTKTPVVITLPYSITAITTEINEKNIILRWNFIGNSGTETVDIFKAKTLPGNAGRIMKDDFIGTENIRAGKFIISNPEEGANHYGIIIRGSDPSTEIKPGINITNEKIVIKNNEIITENKKSEKTIADRKDITAETKNNAAGKVKLDYILKNLFYKEKYKKASKELKKYINDTDTEYEKAKARLFLARSYIELTEYRKGIVILNHRDVKKNFPDEAKFWTDFATAHLK